jgi:hypothetical protein
VYSNKNIITDNSRASPAGDTQDPCVVFSCPLLPSVGLRVLSSSSREVTGDDGEYVGEKSEKPCSLGGEDDGEYVGSHMGEERRSDLNYLFQKMISTP